MECDGPLHLLHHLMDVPVQNRYGPEPLQVRQRLRAIFRAPTPLRVNGPERNMREDDDWRAARTPAQIVFEPGDLCVAQFPQTFERHYIRKPDEMHALM